ncbi:hypothetical protein [Spiroplasma poulsonii]|uniref:hypothetical protein n=1 Tax=Spiroplasma poulsonii TaxID=2138 RepID=UPI001F4CF8CE|nr:hypothetical protein [Spiroplasma poulsonii]UNF62162.1 hypothetical protein MNU24_01475 [Spiroplasma poulsonii]
MHRNLLQYLRGWDPYFKEKSSPDIKDVTDRLIKYILNVPVLDLATININEELLKRRRRFNTTSQTTQLDPKFYQGFGCDMGKNLMLLLWKLVV